MPQLDQFDQRPGPAGGVLAFEQRLLLHRVEVEILRQGVDEILVRHVPRHHRLSAGCLEPIGQQRFELDTRQPDLAADGVGRRFPQRFDLRLSIHAVGFLPDHAKPLDSA